MVIYFVQISSPGGVGGPINLNKAPGFEQGYIPVLRSQFITGPVSPRTVSAATSQLNLGLPIGCISSGFAIKLKKSRGRDVCR